MNRYQNPHAGFDGNFQQPMNNQLPPQHTLPPGHPFGQMYPASMTMHPGADPRFFNNSAPPPPAHMNRGPVVNMGNMQAPQYDPRLDPRFDPRFDNQRFDPRFGYPDQRQMNPQFDGGVVRSHSYQMPPGNFNNGYPQQGNSSSDPGRFGTPERVEQVRQQVPEPQSQQQPRKTFPMFTTMNQQEASQTPDGYKITYKKAAIDNKSYTVASDMATCATLDYAIEAALELLCMSDGTIASQLYGIDDQYFRVDFNREIFEMMTSRSEKDMVKILTEHFRTVKDKNTLIVLNRFNEFMTRRINDMLLVNSKETVDIDSFKDDYFDLLRLLDNTEQKNVIGVLKGFFANLRNAYFKYNLIDDTPEELKTVLTEYVSVTAIDAMAREARIEQLSLGTAFIVQNSDETKYVFSVMDTVRKNFIVEEEVPPLQCDRRYIKHYLVTLDKRLYEMTWTMVDPETCFITRLA